MDYTLYTNIKESDYTNIIPSKIITLNPSFLVYNSDLTIIICIECKLAILSTNNIKEHLKTKHSIFYKSKLFSDDILTTLNKSNITNYKANKDIEYNKYYFAELPLIFNSYKCLKCNYLALNSKPIRKHLIKQHNIKTEDKTRSKSIIYNLPVQCLYPNNKDNYGLFIPILPSLNILDLDTNLSQGLILTPNNPRKDIREFFTGFNTRRKTSKRSIESKEKPLEISDSKNSYNSKYFIFYLYPLTLRPVFIL